MSFMPTQTHKEQQHYQLFGNIINSNQKPFKAPREKSREGDGNISVYKSLAINPNDSSSLKFALSKEPVSKN